MGLYYKNESPEPAKRKVKSGRKVHKRKKRHSSVQMWKLYSIAGILCVLMAVAGVALFWERDAKAVALVDASWLDVQTEQDHIRELPFNRLNDGETVTPSSLGLKLYKEGDQYVSYVSTVEQLKYVISGFMDSYTYEEKIQVGIGIGGQPNQYLTFRFECQKEKPVLFRLANDIVFEISDTSEFNEAVAKKKNTGEDSWDTDYYEGESGSVFKDAFDGQGHTITLNLNMSQSLYAFVLDRSVTEDCVINTGALFARVENTIIENLNLHISGSYFKSANEFIVMPEISEGVALAAGIGLLCGGADNSVFRDINITADEGTTVRAKLCGGAYHYTSYSQIGFGIIVGCMGKYVTVERCDTSVDVQLSSNIDRYDTAFKNTWFAGSALAGIAIGYGNEINACINRYETPNGQERYQWEKDRRGNTINQNVTHVIIHGDLLGIAGVMDKDPEKYADFTSQVVELNDCVVYSWKDRAVGGVKWSDKDSGTTIFLAEINNIKVIADRKIIPPVADDEYPWATMIVTLESGENETFYINCDYFGNLYKSFENYINRPTIGDSDIDNEKGNWFYNQQYGLHLLKDNYMLSKTEDKISCDITFAPPILLDPVGNENIIQVKGILQGWNDEVNYADNSKAEIFVATGEGADPKSTANSAVELRGRNENSGDVVLVTSDANSPRYTGDPTVVNARIKITLNGNDDNKENDIIFWSGLATRTYTEIDTLIDQPVLNLKKETDEEYTEHETSAAYALGTTKWKLTIPGGKNFKMKLYYGEKSGLQITDPDGADYIDPAKIIDVYEANAELTLSQDMIKQENSNLIHLYVLAEAEIDGNVKQKLYEYELITFIKDTLMTSIPEDYSRIPDGSEVIFQIGNGKEAEYPYKEMRILVSDKQLRPLPKTLNGMTGVSAYTQYYGAGTKDDPWYLEAEQKISGSVGSKYYIYVEPITNTEQTHPDNTSLPDREETLRMQKAAAQVLPIGTKLRMIPIRKNSHLDTHCYLGKNSRLASPAGMQTDQVRLYGNLVLR